MKILVVTGWTEDGDKDHEKAGCALQKNIFNNLIKELIPDVVVDNYSSYSPNKFILDSYEAFMWTGGGGNIYENNQHNKSQLNLCSKILSLGKPIWGSCWGMQVIVTALGKKVFKSNNPEFGISKDIKIKNNVLENSIYKNKDLIFDAPAHHYDIIVDIPDDFEVIAENDRCIQSIFSANRNIFCTQYHPELGYDYIADLMIFWKNNYHAIFNETEFNTLIDFLKTKEITDKGDRLVELKNWLLDLN